MKFASELARNVTVYNGSTQLEPVQNLPKIVIDSMIGDTAKLGFKFAFYDFDVLFSEDQLAYNVFAVSPTVS